MSPMASSVMFMRSASFWKAATDIADFCTDAFILFMTLLVFWSESATVIDAAIAEACAPCCPRCREPSARPLPRTSQLNQVPRENSHARLAPVPCLLFDVGNELRLASIDVAEFSVQLALAAAELFFHALGGFFRCWLLLEGVGEVGHCWLD